MFRVATYNIHFGGAGRANSIAAVLNAVNADVVLLVEASDDEVIQEVAAALNMQQISVKGAKSQLAILSKNAAVSWQSYCPKHLERPLLEASFATPTGEVATLYGVHLQCHYFRHNEMRRLAELNAYLDYIRSRPPTPHMILGDFNAIALGDHLDQHTLPLKEKLMLWWERVQVYHDAIARLQAEGYIDCFRALHLSEPGFTLPTGSPHVRLDYIFADPLLAKSLKDCTIVTSPAEAVYASDHYPLIATFDL